MKNIRFEPRNNEFSGDLAAWVRENSPDNTDALRRLKKQLRLAREQELTPRQKEMIHLYYDERRSMTQIAAQLGVDKSTVSRTIARAKKRLYRCLRYSL